MNVKQLGQRLITTFLMCLAALTIALVSLGGAQSGTDLDPMTSALTKAETVNGLLAIVSFALFAFAALLAAMVRTDLRLYSAAAEQARVASEEARQG